MVQESISAQERRVQLQHCVYKVTKNMAPTPTTYSLRSQGPPTTTVERPVHLITTRERPIRVATSLERPIQVQKISAKAAENKGIEATQVQLAARAAIEAFQPVINALTL